MKVNESTAPIYLSDTGMIKDPLTFEQRVTVEEAKKILARRFRRGAKLTSPHLVRDYLLTHLAELQHEVFGLIYLNNQHHVIADEVLVRGTIDEARIYPREVVKECLVKGAAAVILYHNHPSGQPEPSEPDKKITKRIVEALGLVEVRVVDHMIVANPNVVSFAERGLM